MNAHVGGVAAGKFKVGDRVAYSDDIVSGVGVVDGFVGGAAMVAVAVGDRGAAYFDADGGEGSTHRAFDPSDIALIPTFAVGDRIQPKRNIGDFFTVGRTYVIAREYAGVFVLTDNDKANVADAKHHTDIAWLTENFVKASPLRIEAGKTYVTADGTRVGPMVREKYGEGFTADNGHHIYREDGKRIFGGEPTLVAEAPAKPAGSAAAQVDNLADEYGGGSRGPKFKVGDRVRLINNDGMAAKVGATAVVTAIDRWLRLKWDHNDLASGQMDGGYEARDFDLAHPTTLIVALIENGQPKPATRPYIHRSRDAAEKEAKRLAGVHKGKEFGVFELVDTRNVDKPVYEHEWQRLAAAGRRDAAANALYRLAGIRHSDGRRLADTYA